MPSPQNDSAPRFSRSWLWAGCVLALCVGCSSPFKMSSWKSLNPFYDEEGEKRANVRSALRGEEGHSRFVGDYVKVADSTLGFIKVQGIGVVDRLDGTGEDPPDSPYRRRVLESLRLAQLDNPQTYLASPNNTIVIVTAYLPPIVRKGDKVDVEIQLPEGSESTSLAGGYLMPTHMTVHEVLGGAVREGHDLALARGLVMVDDLVDTTEKSPGHRRGIIPGGAVYIGEDRNLTVGIRQEYQTVRMSSQLATRIGARFHDYDEHGIKRPLAKAQSEKVLQLIVHDRYRDNYPRYLHVIRNMMLSEQPVEKHLRLQQLREEIRLGPTAEQAALQLEAIGTEAVPILQSGLGSSSLEARFHAAMALAYLGKADGVPVLKETAANQPAFRVFALASLATMDNGTATEALKELLSHDSVETRYGAFRALSTVVPHDPLVAAAFLPDELAADNPAEIKVEKDDLGRPELPGGFTLHPLDVPGEPLIHLTRHRKAEIVVFGADQQFQMPLYIRAGSRIMVQGNPQGDRVLVKRFAPGEAPQTREVSPRVIDVIFAASDLGAGYPEIAQMLMQAERQQNLPGKVAIDELPKAGRIYERPAEDLVSASEALKEVHVGNQGLVPNVFDSEETHPEGEYIPPAKEETDPDVPNKSADQADPVAQ